MAKNISRFAGGALGGEMATKIYKVVPSKDPTASDAFDVICTRGNMVVNNGLSYADAQADARERQRDYENYERGS